MNHKIIKFIFLMLISKSSFAGNETLIKLTCASKLALFSIQAVSVDYNHGLTYDFMKDKYSLYPYPIKTKDFNAPPRWPEDIIRCQLANNLVYELIVDQHAAHQGQLSLLRNGKPLLRDFYMWHGGLSFFPDGNRVSLLTISDRFMSICGTDSKVNLKCGNATLVDSNDATQLELTLDQLFVESSQPHDDYWVLWRSKSKLVAQCSSIDDVATFLQDASINSNNSERSDANAEVIEKLILKNPSCFISAFSKLTKEQCSNVWDALNLADPDIQTSLKTIPSYKYGCNGT